MKRPDPFEVSITQAYESGRLKPVTSRLERERLKAAARATAIKDRRVNIRLSAGDLQDIQVRALAEGLPYQTLIASILHKYVTGRLEERDKPGQSTRANPRGSVRRAARGDA